MNDWLEPAICVQYVSGKHSWEEDISTHDEPMKRLAEKWVFENKWESVSVGDWSLYFELLPETEWAQ